MDRPLNPAVRSTLNLGKATVGKAHRYQRGHWRWIRHLTLLICDQVLVFLGFAIAYWMRYHYDWPPSLEHVVAEVPTQSFVPFRVFLPTVALLMVVLVVLFESKGLYRLPRGSGLVDYAGIILSSTLTGIALLIVVVFLYNPFFYSRLIFAFAGFNIALLLLAWRMLLIRLQRWGWARGIGQERVLVVGGNGLSKQVMDALSMPQNRGFHLVGYLHDSPPPSSSSSSLTSLHRYLGSIHDNFERVVRQYGVHLVILALPFWDHGRLPQMVQRCRTLGVEFLIVPDLYEVSFDRVDVLHISGIPLIGLKDLSLIGWNLLLKRAIDIGFTLAAAPFLIPLVAIISLLIRLDSPGPAIFRQTRIGKNGRPFTCYKFRTMVVDAEQRKADLQPLNEADGPLFKIRSDPRVTRIGKFLRRSSLDELPQLWNVLRGEMSLVGPRPALPEEVSRYEPWHYRRLEVLPGLTGLWQVLGRSDTSFEKMVRLDIYYAENWSVGMDLHILLKTIPTVLSGKGAY